MEAFHLSETPPSPLSDKNVMSFRMKRSGMRNLLYSWLDWYYWNQSQMRSTT